MFYINFILLFWQECMSTLFEVHTNFICNPIQINDREWLNIKFKTTCNAIFEKNLHERRMFSKNYVWLTENWSWIKSRILMPSALWSPNLDKTLGNISFLQICWFLYSYAIIKLSMLPTSLIPPNFNTAVHEWLCSCNKNEIRSLITCKMWII